MAEDVVEEASEIANMGDTYKVFGKEIRYVQGHLKLIDSGCKWWHYCWYRPSKAISNATVHLYIRTNNQKGGEKWTEFAQSETLQRCCFHYNAGALERGN